MTTTPLPKPSEAWLPTHVMDYYTADQMRTYAAAARADLEAENADLKRKLEEARTLLQGIVDTAADMARAALENKP